MPWPQTTRGQDLVVAVLLTLIAEVELFLVSGQHPDALGLLLSNLLILPAFALRRTQPLWAVCIAAVAFAVDPLMGDAPVATPFLALLVLLVSLGWHSAIRQGAIGVGVILIAGLAPSIVAGESGFADVVVNAVLVIAAWAAGLLLRRASDARVQAEVEVDRAARSAVVAERERIARDLHDSMAHALTLITLQAGTGRERAADDGTRDLLRGIERTGREALTDLHRLLQLVGRGETEALGVAALPDLVDLRRGDLQVDLELNLPEVVPATLSTTIYRLVQEGLTNVVRHSQARQATVGVTAGDGVVRVVVTDSGPARASLVTGAGSGLLGLQERVALLGGSLHSGPLPSTSVTAGRGWRMEATIPWAM